MTSRLPPYPTGNLREWALQLTDYLKDVGSNELEAQVVLLQHRLGDEKATVDGVMMFDPTLGRPIYSHNGVWKLMDGTLA